MRTLRAVALACCLTALPLSGALAAEPATATKTLSLDECIRGAIATAPELGESQADIELAQSRLEEAKGYRFPQIEMKALFGPVPEARGNQVWSPDGVNDTDSLTWFARADATLVQPLYTFGKISENMKAATHGIEVDRAKKDQRRNEVALQTKEYYYGVLLAREMREVVLEVRENLDKARKKAQELLDKSSPNVEELDIYKLDAFNGEVGKYLAEADKGETLAISALRTRIGLPPEAQIDIATERLVPDEGTAGDLPAYIDEARAKRPEFKQLKEGLQAREALVEAAKAAYYPDIFLAGLLSGAYSPERSRIDNPFITDEFNHFWSGIALGVKWKLDFGITGSKVAGERAQYNRLLSTKVYAENNIPLQVKKAWLELKEAEKSIDATRDAYSNAKKWIVSAMANFDFGVGPAKELFDGLQNYARMRAGYFQSIYNQKMSRANLDYAVGAMPLEK
ncbi:TolC family protein [Geobacter hydrogenophilus]|uniref:RND transporter n=1 Tax=Geobacter hydrogenophilus TaxID=40983 RepID=A0A9W6G475_9BACT|nr:TolC family protein [Geobacter hydrogenophilus]MBT0892704.1 TolC family protein [Geobacter hydrogenophilus]GLI40102.1 RND transporter [Geobacter hydrogenophilus]